MQLHHLYQQQRALRIVPLLDFASQLQHHNIAQCYLCPQKEQDAPSTLTETLGELLLSVACPESWQDMPLTQRRYHAQQAIALSSLLRDDIFTLRDNILCPVKE